MKILCTQLCVFFIASSLLAMSSAIAAPPTAKFFPLKRENIQQGVKPAAKFFPINKGKPMKLMFSSSKKNIIYTGDKQAKPPEKVTAPPVQLSEGNASQLLSIYEPVD